MGRAETIISGSARVVVPLVALITILGAGGCGDNNNGGSDGSPSPTPTVEPTPEPTAPPQIPCPEQVTYIVQGDESDLDVGWTGIYFDQQVGTGGALTFAVDCPGEFLGGCGECPISGPITSTTVVDNQRCVNASNVTCTSDADCPGSTCGFFFGAPVPVSGGGVPICVTNLITNDVTGTIIPELGAGFSDLDIDLTIYNGLAVEQPCPICDGNGFDTPGICRGGPRDGASCTVHGTTTLFGDTSFDCPPSATAAIGVTGVPLDLTTGTSMIEPTESCQNVPGACYCPSQQMPNACLDASCTAAEDGEGVCLAGPVDQHCAVEVYRGCLDDDDCPAGDACVASTRKCSGATDAAGSIVGPLTRTGVPSTSLPLQVSVFCIDATASPAVNATSGLPGPAGVVLPTEICIFPSCPP